MYLNDFTERAGRMIFEYEEPLKYLMGRGFTKEDIKRFGFGYLRIAKIKKELSDDYKKLHDETYCFKSLENKIIIPLKNVLGRVNGLVVRSIKDKKYNLYLLKEAKDIGAWYGLYEAIPHIMKTKKVFVHEGAFNSASFSKVFPNTISSLTSFINDQQYELIRMFADKIILIYDEDAAGDIGKNTLKKRYGKVIDTISIGSDDSNSCLQKRGSVEFENYLKRKIPLLLQN